MLPMFKRISEELELKKLIREYGGCHQCGWCCRNERVTLFGEDVIKLGSLLKPEYIVRRDEVLVTFSLPCPFMDKNRCSIYNKRPDVCKTYPFLNHYIGLITVAFDCPLGKKIYDDMIKYCEANGVEIQEDDKKTEAMKAIDRIADELQLNSGKGYQSKIMNVRFEMFKDFLKWREKHKENSKYNKR